MKLKLGNSLLRGRGGRGRRGVKEKRREEKEGERERREREKERRGREEKKEPLLPHLARRQNKEKKNSAPIP